MTSDKLTNEDFVNSLDQQFKLFLDDYYPLHKQQLKAITRCTVLINNVDISKNVPKQRAQTILTDLWTHVPEVFILAALAFTPSKLGSLKSTDYMVPLLKWWEGVKVPGGLAKILDRHSDILPTTSREYLELRLPVSFGELLRFLQQDYGQMPAEMFFPFSGSPSPYVRLGDVKIELSTQLANAFLQQRQQ